MPNGLRNWSYREVKRKLKEFGFQFSHARGSHHYFHGIIDGTLRIVTVPFHGNERAIKVGTMGSIIIQSGIAKERWLKKRRKNDLAKRLFFRPSKHAPRTLLSPYLQR